MKGAVIHGPRDVRFEEREPARIVKPADAVMRLAATCICGSDLWPYRGANPVAKPTPIGHEYCGVVEEVGSAVSQVKPGQFVVGSCHRGRGRRRRGGVARGALGEADGGRAHHRHELPRRAAEAGARVRRDRHRQRARRRGREAHQGDDLRHRRRRGAGVRGHAGIDDAGHAHHAARWPHELRRRASIRARSST
jgi:hypothetical protein